MSHATRNNSHDGSLRGAFLAAAPRAAPRVAAALGALAGLAAPAAACPYCALSQGADTLVYITAFVLLPYIVVTGVVAWMRHILASEHEP